MNSNDTFRFAADDATVGHVFSHSQQQQQQGESDGRRIPDNHHQHQDSVIHSHQPAVEESEGGGNVWNRIRAESNGSSSTTRRSYWPVLPQHDEGITVRGSSTNEWFLSSRGEDPPSAISYQSPVSMMMQPSDDLPPSLADSTTFCPTYVWTRISTPSAHPHPSNSSNNNNTMAHPPPRARSGAASVVVGDCLYVLGGYGGGTGRLEDFWCFDFGRQTWHPVEVRSSVQPGCRENNGVVMADPVTQSIFLFGGYNGQSWLNDLWKFDIRTQCWTCLQESTTTTTTTSPNNPLSQQENLRVDPNHSISNHKSLQGRQRRGSIPSRRFGNVSVVHQGRFIVWGGFDGSRWLNDMYVYTFETNTWTEILPPSASSADSSSTAVWPSVRSCPAWAKDDRYVYIQGGYDGMERKSDFFALNLTTYQWKEMPCWGTPPSPRYFHSCGIDGHQLYLYGGYSGSERLADLHVYDLQTQHWSRIDARGGDEIPSGRSSLVLQVYKSHLYVFGGYNGMTVLNDFYKFRLKPLALPPTSLVQDLAQLLHTPELADVAFLVEDQVVYAHKAILAIRSDYFRVLLCGPMREATAAASIATATTTASVNAAEDDDQKPAGSTGDSISSESSPRQRRRQIGEEIVLSGVSYPTFLRVLEFLYTDTVNLGTNGGGDNNDNDQEHTHGFLLDAAIQLLIASELFLLDRLKALCENLIQQEIQVDNVMEILVAAHRHNAVALKELALDFILQHLNLSTVMDGLALLKSEPDLLVEIIKRNSSSSGHIRTQSSPPRHHHHHHHASSSGSSSTTGTFVEHTAGAAAAAAPHPLLHRSPSISMEQQPPPAHAAAAGVDRIPPDESSSSASENRYVVYWNGRTAATDRHLHFHEYLQHAPPSSSSQPTRGGRTVPTTRRLVSR